jgi:hypothetical protein
VDRQDLSTRKNKVLWGGVIFVGGGLTLDDYREGLFVVNTYKSSGNVIYNSLPPGGDANTYKAMKSNFHESNAYHLKSLVKKILIKTCLNVCLHTRIL